jgi:carbonic anhydrase/acetyltransferase-like protein (isoleucine patch superfamily)
VTKLAKVYGEYAKYFEDSGDSVKRYDDKYDKTKQSVDLEMGFYDRKRPRVSNDTFIAPNAVLAGNVDINDNSSIWYGVIIRGDINLVRVGQFSNVQDNTIVEESTYPLAPDHDGSVIIGHYVTVGHSCLLRGCTLESMTLVGMGSTLLEGSTMEENSQLGAYSVLGKNQRVPSGELWAGNPARKIRDLSDSEIAAQKENAETYYSLAMQHRENFLLDGMRHVLMEKKGIDFTHHSNVFE